MSRVLQIDIENDIKLLQQNWGTLKKQQEFICLSPFTYNIEVKGCVIEDGQHTIPLKLGDVLKVQKTFQKLLLPIPLEIIFYKLQRLGDRNKGCLFCFNSLGEHFIWLIEDMNSLFEAIFPEVGLETIDKNKLLMGDYLCPSIATLEDYLTSITTNVPLYKVVCD